MSRRLSVRRVLAQVDEVLLRSLRMDREDSEGVGLQGGCLAVGDVGEFSVSGQGDFGCEAVIVRLCAIGSKTDG